MCLESAIPPHLQQDRLLPSQTPPDYQPPFPAYTARFPRTTKDLAVAYLGIQDRSGSPAKVRTQLQLLRQNFFDACPANLKPSHHDQASVTDSAGAYNAVLIAYWPNAELYTQWTNESGFETWFLSLDPDKRSPSTASSSTSGVGEAGDDLGFFREVFLPTASRFETVFSDNVVPEGAAHLRHEVSGTIREHVYWGSMRDRMPASQVDGLAGQRWEKGEKLQQAEQSGKGRDEGETGHGDSTLGKRIKVPGRENLAVIRSGQDWSNTSPHERTLYLETMHPILIKGMDFLRDHGGEVGCFSCRFMDVLPSSTSPAVVTATAQDGGGGGERSPESTEKTFGLAYFDDLASLEAWSKQHKTHLDIFGRFLQYAKELENQVSLRLFHEVLVLEPHQQVMEYVNCHAGSGMLASR